MEGEFLVSYHIHYINWDESYEIYDSTCKMNGDEYGLVTESVVREWEKAIKTRIKKSDDGIRTVKCTVTGYRRIE